MSTRPSDLPRPRGGRATRATAALALLAALSPLRAQQPTVEERLQHLEFENKELRALVDGLSAESATRAAAGAAAGDALSKLSVGGYGEFLFTWNAGAVDEADALRSVVYLGYAFDERWSMTTEIEVEHASSGANGEVALEMATIDYRASDDLDLRGGLLLVPMGIYNERHEPTTFLPTQRPETERRILPSTWRELGAGLRGRCDGWDYQLYAITGLDGAGYSAAGLRDGRQDGSKAAADDWAAVGALQRRLPCGVAVGGSAYFGNAGQDNLAGAARIPDLATGIGEVHVEWTDGPLVARALYASAWVDGAGEFAAATGTPLARRLEGLYVEGGYDVAPLLGVAEGGRITPFVRYEHVDTQARMPVGVAADPRQDDEIWTVGVTFQPIDAVVIKIDYADWDHDTDRFTVGFGYAF
ncbi:MAG: hypothetical protein AB7O97_24325 [Planctomycetota bacterium]